MGFGGILAALSPALTVGTQALGGYQQGQAVGEARRHERAREDAERKRQQERDDLDLARYGIFRGGAPAETVGGITGLAIPRHRPLTPGFYEDALRTPEARAMREEQRQQTLAAQLAEKKAALEASERQRRGATVGQLLRARFPERYKDVPDEAFGEMDAGTLTALVKSELDGPKAWAPTSKQEYIDTHRAIQPPRAATTPADENRRLQREGKLRDDFRSEPTIKNAEQSREALVQIQSGYNATKNPRTAGAGDLAMIYGLAKLFDPGSVVREGETVMVRQTGGLPAEVLGWYNRVKGGGTLDANTRKQVMDLAEQVARDKAALVAPVQARYGARARRDGADSATVAYDPWESVLGGANPPAGGASSGHDVLKKYGIPTGRP